jgi:ABC-2 type transport system permease protein
MTIANELRAIRGTGERIDEDAEERAVARRAQRRLVAMEARLALREPAGLIFGLAVPVLLLVVFGNIASFYQQQADLGGATLLEVYLPLLIAMSLSLFGLITMPVPLAAYREQRILRRLATTPVSPLRVLAAQFTVTTTMALVALGLMLGIGAGFFGLTAPHQVAGFAVAVVLGLAGLFGMGLWIAAIAPSGRAAQFIGGGLFYPMQFLAGLWWPQQAMPAAMREVSQCSPLGALVDAMQESMNGQFPDAKELLVLAGYAVVFGCLAVRQFSWD